MGAPFRDAGSAALLASIAQRVESTARRCFDLASEFLAGAGPGAWGEQFEVWATSRQLAPELRRAVQRAILRRRNFGSGPEPRPHGRKWRR